MSAVKYFRCKRCGNSGWESSHKCPPVWYVRPEKSEQSEEREAFGDDPEAAAVNFMDKMFSLVGCPKFVTLIVVNESKNERWTVDVEAEYVPQFNASIASGEPVEVKA